MRSARSSSKFRTCLKSISTVFLSFSYTILTMSSYSRGWLLGVPPSTARSSYLTDQWVSLWKGSVQWGERAGPAPCCDRAACHSIELGIHAGSPTRTNGSAGLAQQKRCNYLPAEEVEEGLADELGLLGILRARTETSCQGARRASFRCNPGAAQRKRLRCENSAACAPHARPTRLQTDRGPVRGAAPLRTGRPSRRARRGLAAVPTSGASAQPSRPTAGGRTVGDRPHSMSAHHNARARRPPPAARAAALTLFIVRSLLRMPPSRKGRGRTFVRRFLSRTIRRENATFSSWACAVNAERGGRRCSWRQCWRAPCPPRRTRSLPAVPWALPRPCASVHVAARCVPVMWFVLFGQALGLSGTFGQLFGSSKSATPEVSIEEIRRLRCVFCVAGRADAWLYLPSSCVRVERTVRQASRRQALGGKPSLIRTATLRNRCRMQNLASVAAVLLHGDKSQARSSSTSADGVQRPRPEGSRETTEGEQLDDLTGQPLTGGSLWDFGYDAAARDDKTRTEAINFGCSKRTGSTATEQNSGGGAGPSIEALLEEVQRLRAENQVLRAHHDADQSAGGVSKLVMHAMGLEGLLQKYGAGSLHELRVNSPEAAQALAGWNQTITRLLETEETREDGREEELEESEGRREGAREEFEGAMDGELLSSRVRRGNNKRVSLQPRERRVRCGHGEGGGAAGSSENVAGDRFSLVDLSARAGRAAHGRKASTSYRSQSDISHGQVRGEQAILSSQRQQIIVWLLWNTCIRDQKNPAAFLALCRQLYEQGILESLSFLSDLPALERSLASAFHQLFGVRSVAEARLHAPGTAAGAACMPRVEPAAPASRGCGGASGGASLSERSNLKAIVPGDVFQHAREQEMKALDPSFAPTRYEKEFEELGVLGHGGYGTVATAQHRIDQQLYAIKRIKIKSIGLRYDLPPRAQGRGCSSSAAVGCRGLPVAPLLPTKAGFELRETGGKG